MINALSAFISACTCDITYCRLTTHRCLVKLVHCSGGIFVCPLILYVSIDDKHYYRNNSLQTQPHYSFSTHYRCAARHAMPWRASVGCARFINNLSPSLARTGIQTTWIICPCYPHIFNTSSHVYLLFRTSTMTSCTCAHFQSISPTCCPSVSDDKH